MISLMYKPANLDDSCLLSFSSPTSSRISKTLMLLEFLSVLHTVESERERVCVIKQDDPYGVGSKLLVSRCRTKMGQIIIKLK